MSRKRAPVIIQVTGTHFTSLHRIRDFNRPPTCHLECCRPLATGNGLEKTGPSMFPLQLLPHLRPCHKPHDICVQARTCHLTSFRMSGSGSTWGRQWGFRLGTDMSHGNACHIPIIVEDLVLHTCPIGTRPRPHTRLCPLHLMEIVYTTLMIILHKGIPLDSDSIISQITPFVVARITNTRACV